MMSADYTSFGTYSSHFNANRAGYRHKLAVWHVLKIEGGRYELWGVAQATRDAENEAIAARHEAREAIFAAPQFSLPGKTAVLIDATRPFAKCRAFIRANIGSMTRRAIVASLIAQGINKNTAATRYAQIKNGSDMIGA